MQDALMEPNQFSPLGAVRRSMQRIGQALQRGEWADLAHRRPVCRVPRTSLRSPYGASSTIAATAPCRRTRQNGQSILHFPKDL